MGSSRGMSISRFTQVPFRVFEVMDTWVSPPLRAAPRPMPSGSFPQKKVLPRPDREIAGYPPVSFGHGAHYKSLGPAALICQNAKIRSTRRFAKRPWNLHGAIMDSAFPGSSDCPNYYSIG